MSYDFEHSHEWNLGRASLGGVIAALERERDELKNTLAGCRDEHAARVRDIERVTHLGMDNIQAARVEVAMLREALKTVQGNGGFVGNDFNKATIDAALSTSGSDWLAQHDREVAHRVAKSLGHGLDEGELDAALATEPRVTGAKS